MRTNWKEPREEWNNPLWGCRWDVPSPPSCVPFRAGALHRAKTKQHQNSHCVTCELLQQTCENLPADAESPCLAGSRRHVSRCSKFCSADRWATFTSKSQNGAVTRNVWSHGAPFLRNDQGNAKVAEPPLLRCLLFLRQLLHTSVTTLASAEIGNGFFQLHHIFFPALFPHTLSVWNR